MCGINGIFEFGGYKKESGLIEKMNLALEKRGPDAEGVYQDEFIHLGHKRLSIIDLDERANQPFESEDHVMVFNGEIYNYQAIKSQLGDYDFKTDSDTEVVLAAYEKWGEHFLKSLNGMFALAIWNKNTKELFIARDRLGIKPLYYVLTDKEIIFSSSLRSILATDLLDRKISTDSLIDYLRFQTVHAPYTLIEGVFCLMPGQKLKVSDEEGAQFAMYWGLTKDFNTEKLDLAGTQSKVRQLVSESVERRMVSDVPFGAFLSGGIDSSIVVALMAEGHNQKVDTFSVIFKENEFSEQKYAKMMADKYQTNHHEIELSVNEFKDTIPEALANMDHPSGDGPNTFVVSKKTKEAGVKMALTGLGGDELFAGYRTFPEMAAVQKKKWLQSFPVYARRPLANIYHGVKGTVASSKIKSLLKQEHFDLEYIYQFYRQLLMDDQIKKLVNVGKLPLNQSFKIPHELIGYGTDGYRLPPLSRTSVAEISTYMQNVLLRDADQMSMAHGLELRVPFMDHELVEFVLGIPDKFKWPTTPKKLLVDSFSDMIPEEIYNRTKMGFEFPYDQWMKTELKDFCEARLEIVKGLKTFNAVYVDKLWKQFQAGHKRVTWSRIWTLVVLGDWMKTNQVSD